MVKTLEGVVILFVALVALECRSEEEVSQNATVSSSNEETTKPKRLVQNSPLPNSCTSFDTCQIECPDDGKMVRQNNRAVFCQKGLQKHGRLVVWYDKHHKEAEVFVFDGKRQGKAVFWYRNGRKEQESVFKDNVRHGRSTRWYQNGQIEEDGYFKDGQILGKCSVWYENGIRKVEAEWKNGRLHGKVDLWHENGQKAADTHFREGKPHLKVVLWYENGQLAMDSKGIDGTPLLRQCWNKRGEKANCIEVWNDVGSVFNDLMSQ